jgi:hypothetical protein
MNPENHSRHIEGKRNLELEGKLLVKDKIEGIRESIQSIIVFCSGNELDIFRPEEDRGDEAQQDEKRLSRGLNAFDRRLKNHLLSIRDELAEKVLTTIRVASALHMLVGDTYVYLFNHLTPDEQKKLFPLVKELYEKIYSLIGIEMPPLIQSKGNEITEDDRERVGTMAKGLSDALKS